MIWVQYAIIGLAGGLLGGLLGVGGGIIMVPLLMFWMKAGAHDAKALSLAVIMFIAVAGTIQHYRLERLDNVGLGVLVVAGVLGATGSVLGANWGEHLSRDGLKKVFAVLLLITAVRMLWPTKTTQPDGGQTSAVTEAAGD